MIKIVGFFLGGLAFSILFQWQYGFSVTSLTLFASTAILAARLVLGDRIKVFSFLFGICLPTLVIFALFEVHSEMEDRRHRISFDSRAWRSSEFSSLTIQGQDEWPIKLRMADDLVGTNKLDGLSRTEVFQLLGAPAPRGIPSDSPLPAKEIYYYLGPQRGFLDSEWLAIRFDGNDRVQNYWLFFD